MTAQLAPPPVFRSWDNLGFPLVGGKLFTYAAGTTTPQATYVDSTQTTPNTNPVILNFRGEAFVWLNPLLSYKFVLQDAFGNLIWTEDNIQGAIGVSSNIIPSITNTFTLGTPTITFANAYFGANGAPLFDPTTGNIGYYKPTAAEAAAATTAGITLRTVFPYGAFRRYGMDPTLSVDSSPSFQLACACNSYIFDDYPGGGAYLFNSQANVSNYPLRIEGSQFGQTGAAGGPGTVFVAGTPLGVGGICINFTSFSDIEVERIKFQLKASAGTLSFIGMQFAQLRNSTIEKCSFFGPGTSGDDTIGINFTGTGTFTGAVSVDKCYFSNHQFGISCQGSITDLRVINSTFYGTAGHPSSIGLLIGTTTCNGLMVVANSFNLWNRCIFSRGSGIKQVGNRFENPTAPWEWVVGTATNHQSVGDTFIGGGVPIFSQSDSAGHQVVGAEAFFSGQNVQTTRSYQEGNGTSLRAFAMGYPQPVTFAAGNFTASGSMTWTVSSGNVSTFSYALVGKMMTVWVSIAASTLGGVISTTLKIAIPGGFLAASALQIPATIENNGVFSSAGSASVAASGAVINVFIDAPGSNNWTLSVNTGVSFAFTFPIV